MDFEGTSSETECFPGIAIRARYAYEGNTDSCPDKAV